MTKDLFSDNEQYQVYNIYKHPDRPKANGCCILPLEKFEEEEK
jgi:hypothetical protein